MYDLLKITALPDDISGLAAQAREEGFAFLDRLIQDFEKGKNRFSKKGEALFEVRKGASLIAVGGLNIDPYASDERVGRVRRFYVEPAFRRSGIGKILMLAIEREARRSFTQLRLLTDTTRAAQFYTRLGYHEVSDQEHVSHQKTL